MRKYNNQLVLFFVLTALILDGFSSEGLAQQATDALLRPFSWRNIGPSTMMGRVSCLDALDDDYKTVLVGSASGGVYKSINGGRSWDIIFDSYGSSSIGYVAFFQKDPSVIWVGTGEGNNRNSSGWGDGIYKSIDGGETFENVGLADTHQIPRILTHPTDKDVLYVAAVGHLWGYSGDRGLYKTEDGGESWMKLTNGLPDDGKTGCTEIVMHPENPDILFCGMYQRLRQPWDMYSGGPNGGIFKSTDGGKSWRKITKGLPTGETGRIGIDFYRSNPEILVACVEASDRLSNDLNVPGSGIYRSEDGGESWTYLYRHTSRPMYHGRIAINPLDDNQIYVISRDYRYSNDGGFSFRGKPWGGAGGDDHDIWISPKDKGVFYVATDQGAHLTEDGGKTWLTFNNMAIGQYYQIGVDMREPYWVYGGLQDNGGWACPSNSRDRAGILVDHTIEVNGGDGFHMQADPTDWRTVYTTAHVGGWGRVNMETYEHKFISPLPDTIINYQRYFDPDFPETDIDYTIDPGEKWLWNDMPAERRGAKLGPQFRFNWNSPVIISPNNPRTIYVAGNYVFKSVDRGDHWRIISDDLTTNDPAKRNSSQAGGLTREVTGAENHCTVISLSESPLDPVVLWAGTDDGNVQVTRNGGVRWDNVGVNIDGVPKGLWCSRVEASHFEVGTAYVSYDGHRSDD
ncbi:MAG: hypothetical protein GY869_32415, partial [Planctomycetes bacterium]|nr:hypothetical protein [Planctomycetota bacterium]